jgi:glucokinase
MTSKVIALDLGGTRIKIGIVDGGQLIGHSIIDAYSGHGLVPRLPVIESAISTFLSTLRIPVSGLSGIGISIPGIVNSGTMQLISVNAKFADAVGFDFTGWAKKTWQLPLVLENDARCAMIGEWQFGAGRGCDNLVMVTLGTGIGGAAVIGGNVLRGKHFQAGCLPGHFTINYHGTRCNCGNIGCVESEASSWRLPDLAAQHPLYGSSPLSQSPEIDYKLIFELAEKGDRLSMDLVSHSIDAWSACVINLIHAYDPERAIVGGGIMRSASRILPEISSRVDKYAWTPWGKVKVLPAEQLDYSALLGLSFLLRQQPLS